MNDGLGPEGSYYEAKAKKEDRQRWCRADAAYPMTITLVYLVLGFGFDLWHPGWLVFLTIPLRYIHFQNEWDRWTHPVSVTLIYLVLGCFWNLWHPGWLIFLLVPALRRWRG